MISTFQGKLLRIVLLSQDNWRDMQPDNKITRQLHNCEHVYYSHRSKNSIHHLPYRRVLPMLLDWMTSQDKIILNIRVEVKILSHLGKIDFNFEIDLSTNSPITHWNHWRLAMKGHCLSFTTGWPIWPSLPCLQSYYVIELNPRPASKDFYCPLWIEPHFQNKLKEILLRNKVVIKYNSLW